MKKAVATLFVLGALLYVNAGQINTLNTYVLFDDSTKIVGTETKYLKAFPQDLTSAMSLLIEARDDTAGYANDSISLRISLEQVFPYTKRSVDYYVSIPSRSNPDSTAWPGSSSFKLFDSLTIAQMCTTCVYSRNKVGLSTVAGATQKYYYGDSLVTLQTSGFGAFTYVPINNLSFSPSSVIKVTGLPNNNKSASGVTVRCIIMGQKGVVTKANN